MISAKKITLFILLIIIKLSVFSQCAMCKAVVVSNSESGGAAANGINNGILYLMFIPYLLMGTVGYFIYRHFQKNNLREEA